MTKLIPVAYKRTTSSPPHGELVNMEKHYVVQKVKGHNVKDCLNQLNKALIKRNNNADIH